MESVSVSESEEYEWSEQSNVAALQYDRSTIVFIAMFLTNKLGPTLSKRIIKK